MTAILPVLRICLPFPVDKLMNAHVDDDDDDDVMRMGNVDWATIHALVRLTLSPRTHQLTN